MPDTDITPIQGFAAGMNQRVLDEQKMQRAPLETELLRAHAGEATLKLANQQKMMQMMSQYGTGQARQGDSVADRADFIGDLYFKSGMPEAGLKAMNYGSLARARAAVAQAAGTRAALNQGKAIVQDLETYDRYVSGATSQEDFDARNASYFAATGKIGMLAGQDWSPQMLEDFTKHTLGAKDRLNLGMRKDAEASKDRLRTSVEKDKDSLMKYREWLKGFRERQQTWREKHSGARVASPNRDEQIELGRLIDKDYPDFSKSDPEGYKNAMFSEAARARELREQNRALGAKEALARAHTEAVKAGDYKYLVKPGFFYDDLEAKYLGGGKTAETAMAVPTGTPAEIKKKLEVGKFYTWGSGPRDTGQWTGTGFSPVAIDSRDLSAGDDDAERDENPDPSLLQDEPEEN